MKAILNNYRQSPRKVRLVADAIKGKRVSAAEVELQFLVKRASLPFSKLLASAVANAKQNFNIEKENLFVKDVRVDKGVVLKRIMPRARGSASRINKRSSHIVLVLEEKGKNEKSEVKTAKKASVKKVVRKTVVKKKVSK
jgi:large subunit ribosomal protein L22